MVDREWRRLEQTSSGTPEELARERRCAARLRGEPYLAREYEEWSEIQAAARRLDEEALTLLTKEVLALEGRDPRWVPLSAFLGDKAALEALGVERQVQSDTGRWVECVHYWGGGEAHLRAALAIDEAWSVRAEPLQPALRAARRFLEAPSQRRAARFEATVMPRRSPQGGLWIWFRPSPPATVFLRRVLAGARTQGVEDRELRWAITEALLRWVRQGSSPASPPSPSIR